MIFLRHSCFGLCVEYIDLIISPFETKNLSLTYFYSLTEVEYIPHKGQQHILNNEEEKNGNRKNGKDAFLTPIKQNVAPHDILIKEIGSVGMRDLDEKHSRINLQTFCNEW
jgi:hypothetical protein